MSPAQKAAVALRCLQGFGAESLIMAPDLVEMGDRLRRWVSDSVAESRSTSWIFNRHTSQVLDATPSFMALMELQIAL